MTRYSTVWHVVYRYCPHTAAAAVAAEKHQHHTVTLSLAETKVLNSDQTSV